MFVFCFGLFCYVFALPPPEFHPYHGSSFEVFVLSALADGMAGMLLWPHASLAQVGGVCALLLALGPPASLMGADDCFFVPSHGLGPTRAPASQTPGSL